MNARARGGVWFGDVIDACMTLGLYDAGSIRRVVDLILPDRPLEHSGSAVVPESCPVPGSTSAGPDEAPPATVLSATAGLAADGAVEHATHLVEVTTPPPTTPTASSGAPVNALVLEPSVSSWQLAPEPLFAPTVDRAIMRELSLVEVVSNRIDIERVVELSAEASPIASLPYRKSLTTRLGVDLLLDTSTSMIAVREDVDAFPAALEAVLGRSAVRVLNFDSVPVLAGVGPKRKWKPYVPDGPKRVIMVTRLDALELVRPWLTAIRTIERATASVLALVPHDPEGVPEILRRAIGIVTWDRRTTAAAVRRIMKGLQR